MASIYQNPSSAASTKPRRRKPDYQIVLLMGLLMLLGLIVMYSIGPQRANVLNNAFGTDYSSSYFFVKQLVSLALSVVVFVAVVFTPYEFIKRYAKLILIVSFVASALLALFALFGVDSIAQCTYGACRWFRLGPLGSLQPSELMKLALVIYGATFLGYRMRQGVVNDVYKTLIPFCLMIALAMLFVVIFQKDLGTGMAIFAIIFAMIFVAGINYRLLGALLLGVGVVSLLLIVSAPHRMARMATFMSGDSSSLDDAGAYHIEHAKIAIGSGGFSGVGIGNSVQATGYLPEAINDSVFAIMGETFGFVGLTIILAIFTALLMRLLRIMDRLSDPDMRLTIAGIFGWLAAHIVLNVAAMIGVFPLTGITLPLLSFGGTSMVFVAAALGLAFQLSRYTSHGLINKEVRSYENLGSRRGVGRTRYASGRRIKRA